MTRAHTREQLFDFVRRQMAQEIASRDSSPISSCASWRFSALAIELAFQSVQELHHRGFGLGAGWAFAGSGFALGATIYYGISRYLEAKGAAIRSPARFREYARERKRHDAQELIGLLSRCDLLRHLPADEIEELLPYVRSRHLAADETLFAAGEPGDALYIGA